MDVVPWSSAPTREGGMADQEGANGRENAKRGGEGSETPDTDDGAASR